MARYQSVPGEDTQDLPTWFLNLTRETLRKQARHLEYQIDNRLITFAQSTTSATPNTSIQQELSILLQNLTSVTNQMGVWVQSNSQYAHLQSRHVANLFEYNREFAKTRVHSA